MQAASDGRVYIDTDGKEATERDRYIAGFEVHSGLTIIFKKTEPDIARLVALLSKVSPGADKPNGHDVRSADFWRSTQCEADVLGGCSGLCIGGKCKFLPADFILPIFYCGCSSDEPK